MYAVCVTFDIRPDAFAAFVLRIQRQAADSLALEPGCHHFDVWTDDVRTSAVYLYEFYTDRRAFEDHLASSHFKDFERETQDMIVSKHVETWTNMHDVKYPLNKDKTNG